MSEQSVEKAHISEADAKKFFMAGMSLGQRYPGATPEIEWASLWSRYLAIPPGETA